jgi:hypothetical protein
MLPDYVIRAYENIPTDAEVSVLIRHSIRYPINSVAEIWTAGLTPEGKEMASNLGSWLDKQFRVSRIETSPIERCVDTGRFISSALRDPIKVSPVIVLAHPNENGEYDSFDGHFKEKSWPKRIQDMAAYLVPNGHHHKGLNLFVSHDTTLVAMTGFWLEKDFRDLSVWPNYLEPFFLWWEGKNLISRFRGEQHIVNNVLQQQPDAMLHSQN